MTDIRDLFKKTAEETLNTIHFEHEGYIHLYGEQARQFLETADTLHGHSGIIYDEDVTYETVESAPHGVEIGLEDWGWGRKIISVHLADPLPIYIRQRIG